MLASHVEEVGMGTTPHPSNIKSSDVITTEEELVILGRKNTRDPLHIEKLNIGNFPSPTSPKRIWGINLYFISTLYIKGCSYNGPFQPSVMLLYGKKKLLKIEHHHIKRDLKQSMDWTGAGS